MTGASSGIGEATAIFFAKKGSSVTLNGRDSNRLQDALAKCKAAASEAGHTDNRFLGVLGDITDSAVRDDLVEQTAKTFGKIDVLVVNHAVVIKDDTFDGVTEEGFDETINVNVKSALFLVKRAVPELERNRGCVVCVSSIASQCTSKQGFFSYTISKAAMDHMARCLALELGPKGIACVRAFIEICYQKKSFCKVKAKTSIISLLISFNNVHALKGPNRTRFYIVLPCH